MTYTWAAASRSLMNAICLPSGEIFGSRSRAGLVVSCLARPPAVGTLQISPAQSKTSVDPSGDRLGWLARRIGSFADAGTATPTTIAANSTRRFTAGTPNDRVETSTTIVGRPRFPGKPFRHEPLRRDPSAVGGHLH